MIGPFLSPCRLRRLQRQSRSQTRRRLRPSSIPPVHIHFSSFFPHQSDLFFPPSIHPSSFSLPLFPAGSKPQTDPSLHKPSPEEYFYQRFCKYWFRFLAQKCERDRRGFSDGVLLSCPQLKRCAKAALQFCLCFFF